MDLELAVQPSDADSRSRPGHIGDGAFSEPPCSAARPTTVEQPPPPTAKSTRVIPSQMAPRFKNNERRVRAGAYRGGGMQPGWGPAVTGGSS